MAWNARGINSSMCSLAAEVSGIKRQSSIFRRFQIRVGMSSPKLGQPWSVAVGCFTPSGKRGWSGMQPGFVCGKTHLKNILYWRKKKKKNCDCSNFGHRRFWKTFLTFAVGVFFCSILIYFPVFWLQFSGNLLSILQSIIWITWRRQMSFESVFWWLGPVCKAFL